MQLDEFGDYILLTNFDYYIRQFAAKFNAVIKGVGKPMQAATNSNGLTIINFGIGSANAATIMDILLAKKPRAFCFWESVAG